MATFNFKSLGQIFSLSGASVEIRGDKLVVDGDIVGGVTVGNDKLEMTITGGALQSLTTDRSVTAKGIAIGGPVKAGGSVECGSVQGSVDAGGSVECGDVDGNVDAGGSIECSAIEGNATAGSSIDCDNVGGSVRATVVNRR